MARLRIFVAVDISTEVRAAGEQLVRRLSAAETGVRWVRPEDIHLTLKFLGDVDDRELHDVCKITGLAAKDSLRFALTCRGLSAFPSRETPSTIWMGVADENSILADLQKRLEILLCDQLGIPTERRPYHGHLTLGRIASRGKKNPAPALTAILEELQDEEFGILRVNEMVVYSSEMRREGPTYTVVGRCPLRK